MATRPESPVTRKVYPVRPDMLPEVPHADGRYRVRLARSEAELHAVQTLRFEVFNLELGEGLEESFSTGLDRDRFDPLCHHLLAEDSSSGEIIGTYRLQTREMADAGEGFYSAGEFDLRGLPGEVLDEGVEIGRACIARDHRNRSVLFLLWKGLAAYLSHNRKRFLFGCCSLTSQDPHEGWRVLEHLREGGHVLPDVRVPPLPGWTCEIDGPPEPGPVHVPRLFRLYLRYGAKVCSPPALDRFFKTIDYLVLIDTGKLDPQLQRLYFE